MILVGIGCSIGVIVVCVVCRVRYATNEEEELNLLEVIEDNRMSLL